MAIDLNALRAKHAELSKTGSGNADGFLNTFLQIKEGTNIVRILPPKEEDTQFYAETKIHRIQDSEGMNRNVHCRKIHGEACPLCDTYYALWKTGNKEDEDTARQIKPRSRYYLNVVDRETGEVKILSVGVILFKKIIAAMLDEDFGDITDVTTGHDFKIVKVMEGKWPRYDQSQPRPKSEAAGSNAEIAGWMDSLHDIYSLVKLEEYDVVKKVAEDILPSTVERSLSDRSSSEGGNDQDYLTRLQS